MNWTNNSLFNFVKKVLKELKIPFNDPCDATYTGDCICSSGSVDIQPGTNVTITGIGTNANPYIINATGGGASNPVVSGTVVGSNMILTLADASTVTINVTSLLDNTNLARVVSAAVDAAGLVTFTRNDATTFTLNLATLKEVVTVNNIASQTPFTNPPASPNSGDEFINTVDSTQWIYDGATWIQRPGASTNLPIYNTYALAFAALGAGKEFRYATANLEGVPSPNNSVQAFT